jgi:hypothetical protein
MTSLRASGVSSRAPSPSWWLGVGAAAVASIACFTVSQSWIYEHVEREICPSSCASGPNPRSIVGPVVVGLVALCVLAISATRSILRSGWMTGNGAFAGAFTASLIVLLSCVGVVLGRSFSDPAADERCEVPIGRGGASSNAECLPAHDPASIVWLLAGFALLLLAVVLVECRAKRPALP